VSTAFADFSALFSFFLILLDLYENTFCLGPGGKGLGDLLSFSLHQRLMES